MSLLKRMCVDFIFHAVFVWESFTRIYSGKTSRGIYCWPVEEYSRKAKFDGKELDLFLTEPEVIAFIRASNLQDDSRRVDSHKEPLLVEYR
jgi:hypothetical protein